MDISKTLLKIIAVLSVLAMSGIGIYHYAVPAVEKSLQPTIYSTSEFNWRYGNFIELSSNTVYVYNFSLFSVHNVSGVFTPHFGGFLSISPYRLYIVNSTQFEKDLPFTSNGIVYYIGEWSSSEFQQLLPSGNYSLLIYSAVGGITLQFTTPFEVS